MKMRIFIYGKPSSGKTTYAESLQKQLNLPVIHTDNSLPGTPFNEIPYKIMEELDKYQNYICEGCSVPRTLRKLLERSPHYQIDELIWIDADFGRTAKQEQFGKGCDTILNEISPKLKNTRITRLTKEDLEQALTPELHEQRNKLLTKPELQDFSPKQLEFINKYYKNNKI